jgi:hypothetical protein
MNQAVRSQEILRRLAIIGEGLAGDQAGPGLGLPASGAAGSQDRGADAGGSAGRDRGTGAVLGVAAALGYDVDAALTDPMIFDGFRGGLGRFSFHNLSRRSSSGPGG